jgi:hypothetical protein
MKFAYSGTVLSCVVILSLTSWENFGHTRWSILNTPAAPPKQPSATLKKAAKLRSPEKALADAVKALTDAKIELSDRYTISMYRLENEPRWGVLFIDLPERHGMHVCVFVGDDGSTRIFPGL